MAYNRFYGDPKITLNESGASLTFKGGQPVMDQGLENAAVISLFTKKGFWGNSLIREESQKIGSDFQKQRTIIDVQTINDVTDAAKNALKWMRDTNVASEIDITVTNPYNDQIKTDIKIIPPGQDAQELLFFKNGINWINQAINPAHERVT